VRYKWAEGSGISNYAQSAHAWSDFTAKPEFTAGLKNIVEDANLSNDARAKATEEYIL
jgi:hypothetical protein